MFLRENCGLSSKGEGLPTTSKRKAKRCLFSSQKTSSAHRKPGKPKNKGRKKHRKNTRNTQKNKKHKKLKKKMAAAVQPKFQSHPLWLLITSLQTQSSKQTQRPTQRWKEWETARHGGGERHGVKPVASCFLLGFLRLASYSTQKLL